MATNHPKRTVDGVEFQIVETARDGDLPAFDVYRVDADERFNNTREPFDHHPTDDEIVELLDEMNANDPDKFPTDSCGCGYEIVRTPDGWQHNVAPWFWGDDHDPQPGG